MAKQVRSEGPTEYAVTPIPRKQADDDVIELALKILAGRLKRRGFKADSPAAVRAYCQLHLGGLEHEEFGVMFLDSHLKLIEFESMFRGTVSQASVYPREVVKRALALNASSVILTHNHPSGLTEPSRADEHLTMTLKSALNLVDVRVIDHLVVSPVGTTSMAERGLV